MSLRSVLLTTSIGLFVALAAPGCSDDDSGSAEKFISDYCGIVSSCCEVWGAKNDNGARCNEVFGFYAMGGVDQAAADACLANMRKDQASGTLCEGKPANSTEDDPCDRVFGTNQQQQNGTTPAGGTCKMSTDCAAPAGGMAVCDSISTGSGFDHYCQAVTAGKEGDGPCTVNIYSNGSTISYGSSEKVLQTVGCKQADGLFCDQSGSKTCKKLASNGSPCTGSGECVEGSFCSNWLCAPDLEEGATCEKYTTTCATGLYCDESTKVCAKLKHLGDPCTDMTECTASDCTDGKCGAGIGGAFSAMMMCEM